eukprot:s116_g6.t4
MQAATPPAEDLEQQLKAWRRSFEARKAVRLGTTAPAPSQASTLSPSPTRAAALGPCRPSPSPPDSEAAIWNQDPFFDRAGQMEMFASHGWLQGLVCAGVLIHHGGSQILSHLVVEEKMPFHNPEHSCPTKREVDWPSLKAELHFYASQAPPQRRLLDSENAAFEWRIWVARVYVSNDVDFCPLGLQTVHLTDVDRRIDSFDADALAEVFEAHYAQYTTRIPFLLAVLSGWPLFKIMGEAIDSVRARADFPHSWSKGICGGAVQTGDILSAMRMLFDDGLVRITEDAMATLARILTRAEEAAAHFRMTSESSANVDWHAMEDDCELAVAFGHLGRAVVLASLQVDGAPPDGVERYFGKILEAVEAGEAAWHRAAEAARRESVKALLLRVYAGGWPVWQLLAKLQKLTARRPWALRCRDFDAAAPLCPACALPQQAEWTREGQWVSALAAGGARGEFEAVVHPRLRAAVIQDMIGAPAVAAAALLDVRQADVEPREAWATLLSDDDAVANEAGRRALLVYAEAVRVMARSVRRAEGRVASDAKVQLRPRPFLVLMTEAALTDEVRNLLEGDGLMPLVLPTFGSDGVVLPSRRKQRGETGALRGDELDEDQSDETETIELSWWLKIKLWSLTQYRRIVYLDADILAMQPIDELFGLPEEVAFAAPAHLSRDGTGSEISVGVMSLRPDRRIYEAMISFLSGAAEHFVTGVRSVDQMLQHSFFASHFHWGGYPRWEVGTGRFAGCSEDVPPMSPSSFGSQQESLGLVCVLPPRYDFCVSYPALVAGMDSPEFQEAELAIQFLQPGERAEAEGFSAQLRAKLLHWTGPRRNLGCCKSVGLLAIRGMHAGDKGKPWLHFLSISRTTFDNLWWSEHDEMCSEVEAQRQQSLHGPLPCQFDCASL